MNVLLSYPRSGNHLTRFFIELLTGKPTQGCVGSPRDIPIYKNTFPEEVKFNIKDGSEFGFHKHHEFHFEPKELNKLIFIIRNPKECMPRHTSNNFKVGNYDRCYFGVIDKFDEIDDDKKMLLYYEDIITDKMGFINKLIDFIGITNQERIDYVKNNLEKLFLISSRGGKRAWGGCKSQFSLSYHFDKAPKKYRDQLIPYLENKMKNKTYQKYLSRYFN